MGGRGAGKGGKNRKKAKNFNMQNKREIQFKEEGQEYAQVLKMLGNGRLEAWCFDGQKRICTIRGKLKNRVWINAGDIVLLGMREFADEKADVILKYADDEAKDLKAYGEIPENTKINEAGEADIDDEGIEFADPDADKKKKKILESDEEDDDEEVKKEAIDIDDI